MAALLGPLHESIHLIHGSDLETYSPSLGPVSFKLGGLHSVYVCVSRGGGQSRRTGAPRKLQWHH